jgi:chloramphenicol 3-O-phosphotransferase
VHDTDTDADAGTGRDPDLGPSVVVITGVMASGKSTVADALARRLPRGVHVRGDMFRRMIVSGREDFLPGPTPEAVAQLHLRHRLTATVADLYADDGWTAVVQDVVLGPELDDYLARFRTRPLHLVVLAPDRAAVAAREAGRAKSGYGSWTIEDLDHALRAETPRRGLWLDTSTQTPDQTATAILAALA